MLASGKSARFGMVSAILARLCMLLSLWQAPIPWLHNHGTSTSLILPVTAAQELDSHLIVFHPSVDRRIEREFGWHCHWVLPAWKHALDDTPDDEPPLQEVIVFDAVDVPTVEQLNASFPPLIVVGSIHPAVYQFGSADSFNMCRAAIPSTHLKGHSALVLRC